MNTRKIAIFTAVGSLLFSLVAGASENDCIVRTAAQRASWVAGIERRLLNHDSANAARMSKAVSEIINGDVDALKIDINAGLSSNSVLRLGDNAASDMSLLTLAAAACQSGIAEQLIAAGASVNGAENSTPLVAAGASGDTSLVALLIQHGASVDKIDENGHTALEDAVRQRHVGTVEVLLSHGSNPNRDVGGGTILDLVAHSSATADQSIAGELRAYGAGAALMEAK